jgi:RNA polymerase sigma-70 factor (ECF subfamily)
MWPLSAVVNHLGFDPRRRGEDPAADRDAIRRIIAGEAGALAELYDRLSGSVFSLVLRIVDDWATAEDLVQEVFTQAWRQASRYDAARGSVAAWLLTIARSRAIDYLRSRRARIDGPSTNRDLPPDPPDLTRTQESMLLTAEQVARLREAMADLPLLQRLPLELAYYEGFTQAEIAERLEQPLGTIKTRIRLGLLRLREALGGVNR